MSVVQIAEICQKKILLTGDTGTDGLNEAADYCESLNITMPPNLRVFDVPHHGSRRNVSSATLDRWLGPKLNRGEVTECAAIISAAKEDTDHPRKAVIRGCMHRGAKVLTTEESCISSRHNAPNRSGWTSAMPAQYPEDQEK